LHEAWRAGRVEDAIALQDQLLPLHDAMFCEPNPGPAKYGASLLGFTSNTCRLPLAPVTAVAEERVRTAMRGLALIG
jgi:4-hydroxy-tetrahydrodipicolinate synthase